MTLQTYQRMRRANPALWIASKFPNALKALLREGKLADDVRSEIEVALEQTSKKKR